ncbi:MAG TPA: hypothetical protein VNO26_09770 [Candidatus Limnocylindria bacterium]|nr:hypothetical protein [Candidatus Limnocylindria bacterium]
MRKITSSLLVAGGLVLAASAWAERPEPITCPEDIGVALAEQCPCEGRTMPDLSVRPWQNHGQYVSCVVRYRNALRKAGCFADRAERREIARCAARSTCGKTNRYRCCTYVANTCNDPAPGDIIAEGTCSHDPLLPCDVDADCTASSARIVRDAEQCTADGGVVVGDGSVCEPCPAPPQ